MKFLILSFQLIVIIFKFLNPLLLLFLSLLNQLHIMLKLFRELFLLFYFIQQSIAFLNLIRTKFLNLLPFEHSIRHRLRYHALHLDTLRIQESAPLRIELFDHFLRFLQRLLQPALLLLILLLIALQHLLHFLRLLLFLLDPLHVRFEFAEVLVQRPEQLAFDSLEQLLLVDFLRGGFFRAALFVGGVVELVGLLCVELGVVPRYVFLFAEGAVATLAENCTDLLVGWHLHDVFEC